MKLTAWQMIAALAVLFAAIILAHVFAPAALAVVVPMVTTAFAALGLSLKSNEPAPPADPPKLRVIEGGATDAPDEPEAS